jgi:hypothetical protein
MNKQEAIKKLFIKENSPFGEVEIISINEERNIVKGTLKHKNKSVSTIETKYFEEDILNVMEGENERIN